jgi:hypothetical protein
MTRLLATTALLALLAGGAQAEGSLPKAMLGGWCAIASGYIDGGNTWSHSTYVRSSRGRCRGDWLQLRARGYVEDMEEGPFACRFMEIRQLDKARFAVTARCQASDEPEQMEFELSGGTVLTGSVKILGR